MSHGNYTIHFKVWAQIFKGLELEYRFHPTRKWRFDAAWPANMLALEIEGGIFSDGRHTRGSGFIKDMEKYNSATVLGWRILRVSPQMVDSGEAMRLLESVLHRAILIK